MSVLVRYKNDFIFVVLFVRKMILSFIFKMSISEEIDHNAINSYLKFYLKRIIFTHTKVVVFFFLNSINNKSTIIGLQELSHIELSYDYTPYAVKTLYESITCRKKPTV